MISQEKRALFIHIPKCGGTYIENCITPNVDWHEIGEKHLSLAQSIQLYGRSSVQNCFRFTLVRNPFARIVSAYLFYQRHRFEIRRSQNIPLILKLAGSLGIRIFELSFLDFVIELHKNNRLVEWAVEDLRPATEFIRQYQGLKLHRIYYLENMDECVNDLSARGLGNFNSLNRVNAAPNSYDFTDYYCEQSKDLVMNIYKEDFKNYYKNEKYKF